MSYIGQIVIIALRFIIPCFMPYFPFDAVWANFLLDVTDGDLLGVLGMNGQTYQLIDKAADYWSYIFMVIAGRNWKIRKTLYWLFGLRTIGQFLFFTTQKEIYLFYFPNFLGPLITVYVTLMYFLKSEEAAYRFYRKYLVIIWILIVIYKMAGEWTLHYANIDLSLLFFGLNGNK